MHLLIEENHVMANKTGKNGVRGYQSEIMYDEGRLVIRRLGTRRYAGFRVESWEYITGTQSGYIKNVHDIREHQERKERAGLITGEWGREFSSEAATKRRNEHKALARCFMTSATWEPRNDPVPPRVQKGRPEGNTKRGWDGSS